jgi:hypothetical protein
MISERCFGMRQRTTTISANIFIVTAEVYLCELEESGQRIDFYAQLIGSNLDNEGQDKDKVFQII